MRSHAPRLTPTLPIGLYDSGVGGLSVLDQLLGELPGESYVYFGDTLNMPYGNKSKETLRGLVEGILEWLCREQGVKLVAVACNTTAGMLYEELQSLCPVPLVDPITPLCTWIAREQVYSKVGILATPKTVESGRYETVIADRTSKVQTRQVACEGLASLIEQGQMNTPECQALFMEYARPLLDWGAEAIVLGCTHYPHLMPVVRDSLPEGVDLLDPALWMGRAVREELAALNLLNPATSSVPMPASSVKMTVSDAPQAFLNTALCLPLGHVVLDYPPHLRVMTPGTPQAKEVLS